MDGLEPMIKHGLFFKKSEVMGYSPKEVWDLGISYAKALLEVNEEKILF